MAKNSYKDLTDFFTTPKFADQRNMGEKNIPQWLFEDSTTQDKNKLPNGLDWPCYLGGSSKSLRGIFFLSYLCDLHT